MREERGGQHVTVVSSIRTVERELLVFADSQSDTQAWMEALQSQIVVRGRMTGAGGHNWVQLKASSEPDDSRNSQHAQCSERESFSTLRTLEETGEDEDDECYLRIPGVQSMFWDVQVGRAGAVGVVTGVQNEKTIFLPSFWNLPHVRAVRFPDYLDLANNHTIIEFMKAVGESRIVFSDWVHKFNRANRMQRR